MPPNMPPDRRQWRAGRRAGAHDNGTGFELPPLKGKRMARIAFCIAALLAVTSALANSPMLVDGAGHAIGYYIGPVECPNGIAVLSRLNYLACIRTTARARMPVRTDPRACSAAGKRRIRSPGPSTLRWSWTGSPARAGFGYAASRDSASMAARARNPDRVSPC